VLLKIRTLAPTHGVIAERRQREEDDGDLLRSCCKLDIEACKLKEILHAFIIWGQI